MKLNLKTVINAIGKSFLLMLLAQVIIFLVTLIFQYKGQIESFSFKHGNIMLNNEKIGFDFFSFRFYLIIFFVTLGQIMRFKKTQN
ncbi:MAG: hypothetical protein MUE53_08330 [Chitinophagales bacterium]|jgi:hypothetical protein|nr:hypothetical protein [Chitinophagales bacterium]